MSSIPKHTCIEDAISLIKDDDFLCTAGFVGCGVPDELLKGLQNRFLETGSPRNLSLLFAAGQGDGKERGINRLAHKGLIKRVIGGHWGLAPKMAQLALDNEIEAYNLPQGCISQLYRDIAAGKPGMLSRIGLGTFVDPRQDGGKINAQTTDDIVQLIELNGKEWLLYHSQPINVAFLRATTADSDGNLSMEREALTLDALAMAMAVKNNGGIVIAQVERLTIAGAINPRLVQVPGILVDHVIVSEPDNHAQTYATQYSPYFSGEIRAPVESLTPMPLNERKIIARRAAQELPRDSLVNLGIGMPEGIAAVAAEENVLKHITLTAEPGVVGGIPANGLNFGAAFNPEAIVNQNQLFDLYDGGGLAMSCLGLAQCDARGDINVSRFNGKLAGIGGFVNISQSARKVIFAGTFTTGGLKVEIANGKLNILQEGRQPKFIQQVEQISFNSRIALEHDQTILYVTERCVFALHSDGLELIEIAPGIDLEKDILAQMEFEPIINHPRLMDEKLFYPAPIGLNLQP